MFCSYLIFGTITWLVAQILAVPLRPVNIRPAMEMTFRRWKTFAGTGMMSAILTLIGYVFCILPGVYCSIFFALVAPVVMMENLRGFDALKRSKTLVKRSLRTTVAVMFIMFFVPMIGSSLIIFTANSTAKQISGTPDEGRAINKTAAEIADQDSNSAVADDANKSGGWRVKINNKDVLSNQPSGREKYEPQHQRSGARRSDTDFDAAFSDFHRVIFFNRRRAFIYENAAGRRRINAGFARPI